MQSAPVAFAPPALPSISKDDARLWKFLRPVTLTFDWKLALHLFVPWGTCVPISLFSAFLHVRVTSPHGTHVRTDRRTDGRAKRVMWSIGGRTITCVWYTVRN